jgi:hypothetical protein
MTEISQAPQAPQTRQTGQPGISRPLLWLAFAIFAVGNVVTSTMNSDVLIGIGFGLLTLSCGVALAVQHYRHRR